jgi:uncharacterized protein YcbK (DUF882 family)
MERANGVIIVALATVGLVCAAGLRTSAGRVLPDVDTSQRELAIDFPGWSKDDTWAEPDTPFARFGPIRVVNINTRQRETLRLYRPDGRIDGPAAETLDAMLGDARDPNDVHVTKLDRRTLQLVFRAAYHFAAREVLVISAYRQPGHRSEGMHGEGKAIDFRLPGISAAALASYLRKLPRVGVGVYTNPGTQYVHLDNRERSFHWLDASPPGRHWRERPLSLAGLAKRDAAYACTGDWPEGPLPDAAARCAP